MDKGMLGARNQVAQARMIAAARALAVRFGVGGVEALAAQGPDVELRAMRQREAVADLLEALVEATTPAPTPEPKRRAKDA